MTFTEGMELVGRTMDVAGVAAIVVGALVAALLALSPRRRYGPDGDALSTFRRRLGRAILLGLELLVAADIIRTVAISPTFESVAVLGLIVLIRTFLSWSLELEISGRWPWQKRSGQQGAHPEAPAPAPAPTPGPAAATSEPHRERHDGDAPA